MISPRYLEKLKTITTLFFSGRKNIQVFIFGSSVVKKKFGDIDIGIAGDIRAYDAARLKETLELSNFPFVVDVIDFNRIDDKFKKNVFKQKILWITH